MHSYSETDVFNSRELNLLQKASLMVAAIPDIPGLRCHEVARAIGKILDLQVQDGHYGLVEHSWLWVNPWKPGLYPPNVLDTYSVGSLPQVRLANIGSIGVPNGYRPGPERTDIKHNIIRRITMKLMKL